MGKLKVYRTPAGFHDAYVAAPSQKAALKAWGSDADLFQRGIAEIVTDPALIKEPLARPGEVIKRPRTMADAASEPPKSRAKPKADEPGKPAHHEPKVAKAKLAKPKAAPKLKPRPSRSRLAAADDAFTAAEKRHADERAALQQEEAALAKRRRDLDAGQAKELARLEAARDKERARYDKALAAWPG